MCVSMFDDNNIPTKQDRKSRAKKNLSSRKNQWTDAAVAVTLFITSSYRAYAYTYTSLPTLTLFFSRCVVFLTGLEAAAAAAAAAAA